MPDLDYSPFDGEAVVTKDIQPYQYGNVQYLNSWYLARCEQNIAIPVGSFVRVLRWDENRLIVEPVDRSQPPATEALPFFSSAPGSRCGEAEDGALSPADLRLSVGWAIALFVGGLLTSVAPSLPAMQQATSQSSSLNFAVPTDSAVPQVQGDVMAEGDRCESLEIPTSFCRAWLDEVSRHSQRWHQADDRLLSRLAGLSLAARSQLGFYTNGGDRRQQQILRDFNIHPDYADSLANQRFYRLFPRRRGQRISATEAMTAQVWWACREDVLLELQQEWE